MQERCNTDGKGILIRYEVAADPEPKGVQDGNQLYDKLLDASRHREFVMCLLNHNYMRLDKR